MASDVLRALADGDEDALDRWLGSCGDVDRPLEHANTALCLAARAGQRALVERLVEAGANLETRGAWIGRTVYTREFTPLLLALEAGHADAAHALLDAGARPDVADENGATALMMAARCLPALVPRLVEAGVELDATDEDGWTALRYAAEYQVTAALDALLAAGADTGGRTAEELHAMGRGEDGVTLADARELLLAYEQGGAPPAEDLAERLTEELAILCAEEGVAPPPGGFELEVTGEGGAVIHHRPLDEDASIYGEGPLPAPDLRLSLSRRTLERLEYGGELFGHLEQASNGMALRPVHLARVLASPVTARWIAAGGTFLCRLAHAPDAALIFRFAPARSTRACVLTFPTAPLVAWLRREIDLPALFRSAGVGGPDHALAGELVGSLARRPGPVADVDGQR